VIERDRAPDQLVGAQCRGGSRARRRGRPRLCGGRLRGPQPRAALIAGCEGHQGSDHEIRKPGHEGVDLVNRAGQSLGEIVESIKNLATFVSEIARASAEQSDGVDQVNKALSLMDQATQQNSALVEENAATAKTLERQAAAMSERVGTFKFGVVDDRPAATEARAPSVAAGAPPAARQRNNASPVIRSGQVQRGPVGRLQSTLATALKVEQECEEF